MAPLYAQPIFHFPSALTSFSFGTALTSFQAFQVCNTRCKLLLSGQKETKISFANSSPLTQSSVDTLFSVLYINLGNTALQNSFTLLISNHWEEIQITEAERIEEAGEMAVCGIRAVLKGERKKLLYHNIHSTKRAESKKEKNEQIAKLISKFYLKISINWFRCFHIATANFSHRMLAVLYEAFF